MFKNIQSTVIAPLTTRLGTLLAGILAPFGVQSDYAHMLAIGTVGLGLIGCDLVLAYLRKQKIIANALDGQYGQ